MVRLSSFCKLVFQSAKKQLWKTFIFIFSISFQNLNLQRLRLDLERANEQDKEMRWVNYKKVSLFNENKASQPLSCSIQKFLSRKEKKEEEDLFNKLAKESGIFGVWQQNKPFQLHVIPVLRVE